MLIKFLLFINRNFVRVTTIFFLSKNQFSGNVNRNSKFQYLKKKMKIFFFISFRFYRKLHIAPDVIALRIRMCLEL